MPDPTAFQIAGAVAPRGPQLAGWGRVFGPGRAMVSDDLLRASASATLLRGLGRSYGDSALPAPGTLDVVATPLADRILAWDPLTRVLRAEAGLSLYTLNRLLHPRGFFIPVTPGTQFVTLGGMVASDVHGKNHHVSGTIGRHVRALRMHIADGSVLDCSPTVHPDLFWATVGGMGLTGAILEVELTMDQLPSQWIDQVVSRHGDFDSLVHGLTDASANWPMTVAWIDCLKRGSGMGRGVLYAGKWAEPDRAPQRPAPWLKGSLPFPIAAPFDAFVPPVVSLLNTAVYWRQLRPRAASILAPEPFFYPLDGLQNWNRAYGPKGFTQHQAIIPREAGPEALRHFLDTLTSASAASFLCVLKDCGAEGRGMLSFPRPGTSIAVDLPVRADTPQVIARLNDVVIEVGGRIYLTKDRYTTPEQYAAMDPRIDAFLEVRRRWDPQLRFRSAQSVRMFGDPPLAGGVAGGSSMP